jgi:hypothetical protein
MADSSSLRKEGHYMDLDKEKIEHVLALYGFCFDDIINAKRHKVPVAEQDWIYLIHHMHPPKKESEMETIHHCFLYSQKNLKGKRFTQKHVKENKVFQHVLDIKENEVDKAPDVVYDHLNNGFKIVKREIGKKKYAVISGPVSLKKTKWSEQDKN